MPSITPPASSTTSPGRRTGWGAVLVLALMVVLPIAEIVLLVQIGQQIGLWWTLAILVGQAVLGAWLMQREGSRAWKALNQAFATGRMPTGELADTALILVGGVLLMMPGFITDVVGLLFLLPFTRPLARKALAYAVARRLTRLGMPTSGLRHHATVIEGETVPGPGAQSNDPGEDPNASSSGPVVIRGEIEDERHAS